MTTDIKRESERLYGSRDVFRLEPYFTRHINAMTVEGLTMKGDIAMELAHRDERLAALQAEVDRLSKDAEWRPIESAPRDGSVIFCFWTPPKDMKNAVLERCYATAMCENGYWHSPDDCDDEYGEPHPLDAPSSAARQEPDMTNDRPRSDDRRHPDAVVRRARKIDSFRCYTLQEVRMHLLDEGHDVPLDTLHGWISGLTRAMA